MKLSTYKPLYTLVLIWVLAQACQPSSNDSGQTPDLPQPTAGHQQPATPYTGNLPLEKLRLPEGYGIDVFAESLENARSIAYAGDGLVFVSTREEDHIYAVQDTNGDMRADRTWVIGEGFNSPNGIALMGEDLYLATINQILRYPNIRQRLDNPGEPELVYGGYPTDQHHGWKFISFGPDGKLYIPVGAPCNICDRDEDGYSNITRLDVKAANPEPEIYARGVRNSVGFTWHPESRELWFTDNGRDMLGDDIPPCELNRVPASAQNPHFGYPFCHGGTISDPEFGDKRACSEFIAPAQNLGPHTAPLGMEFVTAEGWDNWKGQAFIAEHGSWNRTVPIGYRITRVPVSADHSAGTGYEVLIDGWLDPDGTAWGRPGDLEFLPDGSMLISDDMAGVLYRVYRKAS